MANRLQQILNPLSGYQKEQRKDLGLPSQRRVDSLDPNSPSHSPSRSPASRDRVSAPASMHSPLASSAYTRANHSEYNSFHALDSPILVTKDEITKLVSLQLDARFKTVGDALAETVAAEDAHDEEVLHRLELVFERLGLVEKRLSALSLKEIQRTDQVPQHTEHFDASVNIKSNNVISSELELSVGASPRTKSNINGPLNSVNSTTSSKISSADISVILQRLDSIDSTLEFTSSRINALETKLDRTPPTSTTESHSHTNSPSDIINSNLPHPRRASSSIATPDSPTSTKASFRLSNTLTAIPNLGISNSLAKFSNLASLSRPSSRNSSTSSVSAAAVVAAALAAETGPPTISDSIAYTSVNAQTLTQKSLESSNGGFTLDEGL
ncbi:hypothetical protein HK100_012032 [Physocladia obscura]|uniref:Uncharacterized protein n=1 Tax=Physocladia obscura TaxID=109957 RepID=A0AAD5XHW9_9FUNG|nr:hypothetical protein HK100_012032 [Physocladia obscura]